jgi:hypothetical protein
MVRLSDWQTETVACPSCSAVLKLTVDLSVNADLDYDQGPDYKYANKEDRYNKDIIGKYTKRLPNIGLYSGFFDAYLGDNAFLCNGNFALKGIKHLELQMSDFDRKASVCLDSVINKYNGEFQEIFPDEMTCAFVRVRGGIFDRIFIRRDLDFLYAVFPDARLYSLGEFEGLIAKSGDDICGFIMSMNVCDPDGNPWKK